MIQDSIEDIHNNTIRQGKVFKKTLGKHFLHANGESVVCSISSKLRKELVYPEADPGSLHPSVVKVSDITEVDPVAIGDVVDFIDSGDGTGMIVNVRPRRNHLSRRAPGSKPLEQVIAANVDQIVAVCAAAQPKLKWNLLDRYLADAEFSEIPAVICITKIDLADESKLMPELHVYEKLGYPVVLTSSVTQKGLDEIKEVLEGRVTVFVGKSGVGKTTLLNAIQPGLGLKVNDVSEKTGKGKHTTSNLEMHELDCGGHVIDTPGMREFGLWGVKGNDIAELFPEMRHHIGHCKFEQNCTHSHEPDCAIKDAVEAGQISERRYQSYLRLRK